MKRIIERLQHTSENRDDYHKEVPEIDAFLVDIFEVYKKHNLAISHEDGQGGFVIESLNHDYIAWLIHASDGRDE